MINKRYLPPAIVGTFIKNLPKGSKVKTIGYSVQKRPISLVSIGVGNTKILLWSQMHGNESTTTKALFDFIPWFLDSSQQAYQKKFTLNIILQLVSIFGPGFLLHTPDRPRSWQQALNLF